MVNCERAQAQKKGGKQCEEASCAGFEKHCLTCHSSVVAGGTGCVWKGRKPAWALGADEENNSDDSLPPAAQHLIDTHEPPRVPTPEPPAPTPEPAAPDYTGLIYSAVADPPAPAPKGLHNGIYRFLPMKVDKMGVVYSAESITTNPIIKMQWRNPKHGDPTFRPFVQKARRQHARAAREAIYLGEPDWKRKAEDLDVNLEENHRRAKKLREENDSLARRLAEAEESKKHLQTNLLQMSAEMHKLEDDYYEKINSLNRRLEEEVGTATNALKEADACLARSEASRALQSEASLNLVTLREDMNRLEEKATERVEQFSAEAGRAERKLILSEALLEDAERKIDEAWEREQIAITAAETALKRAKEAEDLLAASQETVTAELTEVPAPVDSSSLQEISTACGILQEIIQSRIDRTSPPVVPSIPSSGLFFPPPSWMPMTPLPEDSD